MATAGAQQHAIDPDIVTAARARKYLAHSVQNMMLNIVKARNASHVVDIPVEADVESEVEVLSSDSDVELVACPSQFVSDTDASYFLFQLPI